MRLVSCARLGCAVFVLGGVGSVAADDAPAPASAPQPPAAHASNVASTQSSPPPPTAAAATSKPPIKPAAVQAEAQRIAIDRLEHGDAAAIEQALGTLAGLNNDAAAKAIAARLRRGLPPQLTETAIDSLVLLQRAVAAPVLLELTAHRRTAIRAKAVAALGALRVRTAQSALLYALDDPNAEVRSAAVQVLAQVGNARALPALFTAAGRGVVGAWAAIGNLAGTAEIPKLLAAVHDGDITPLRPALDTLFARTNVALEGKLRLLRALEKLDSPSARSCAVEWLAAHKVDAPAPLRVALFETIKRMDLGAAAAQRATNESKPAVAAPPAAAPKAETPAASGHHAQRTAAAASGALAARQESE